MRKKEVEQKAKVVQQLDEQEQKTKAQTETQIKAQTETQIKAQTETQIKQQTETQIKQQTETQTKAQTETQIKQQTETQTKTSDEVKSETQNGDKSEKQKKRIRRRIVVAITTVAALVIAIIYRGNYLEMKELGENYLGVFWRSTTYYGVTFLINFIIIYFAFYTTNKAIRKTLKVFFDEENKVMPKFPNKSLSFVIALCGGLVATSTITPKLLLVLGNSWFGISNSIFKIDISFSVFWKPLLSAIISYIAILIIATLAYGLIYSIIILNVSFDGVSRETFTKAKIVEAFGPRIKLFAIIAGLFVLVYMVGNIGNENFMNIELSDGEKYKLYGAGKADATIKLIGYVALAFLVIVCITRGYNSIKNKNVGKTIRYIMIVPVYLIVLALVLAVYQGIFLGSNQLDSNEEYVKENINNTRQAYGITAEETTINYEASITQTQISENANLLNNIDLASSKNVLQDCMAAETSKGYYTYRETQIEQYNIDGVSQLVYITPREISNNNTTYSNKTYQYTHGYGIIVTKAGDVDEYGNLDIIQDKFGDLSSAKISITQPRIYYGLENNNTVVIKSEVEEFDYPADDGVSEVEYNYEGETGLNLSFLDRLAIGIKEKNLKLAFSGLVKDESLILLNRNIINRAKLALPYITYDNNPYMVVSDSGELYWVLDGYTTSNDYPFAQKSTLNDMQQINYIRNSVKVIINAYTGDIKFYITDRNDPIVMAYNNVFPDLFTEEAIPADISSHFVYPELLYEVQAQIIQQYHATKTENLYRGKDIWQIAKTMVSGRNETIEPYYTMVNVNGSEQLGLIIPYSTYDKTNLTAYLVGTIENGSPLLRIYSIPSTSNAMGPIQLETLINQDESIASEIAALSTTGTKITKRTMAIPIDNTVLYVQTIYQQLINESTQRPTLKKVVVASGNKIAIGSDLTTAIHNLLSKQAIDIIVSDNEDIEQLITAIIKANQNVKSSSQSGSWKLYGEDMEELTSLIDKLEAAVALQEKTKKEEAAAASNTNNAEENLENAGANDGNETVNTNKTEVGTENM